MTGDDGRSVSAQKLPQAERDRRLGEERGPSHALRARPHLAPLAVRLRAVARLAALARDTRSTPSPPSSDGRFSRHLCQPLEPSALGQTARGPSRPLLPSDNRRRHTRMRCMISILINEPIY